MSRNHYSSAAKHVIAIESLERFSIQMDDLIGGGMFGEHGHDDISFTRFKALDISRRIDELRRSMEASESTKETK